jgi:hypothetical protein
MTTTPSPSDPHVEPEATPVEPPAEPGTNPGGVPTPEDPDGTE